MICRFAGCDNEIVAKELCNGHYAQKYTRKQELRPLRNHRKPSETFKTCKNCGNTYLVNGDNFYARPNARGNTKLGYSSRCKSCFINYQKAYQASRRSNA